MADVIMTKDLMVIEGARIKLHFSLALDNASGDVIDSTFGDRPAELVVGDGNLPEGFESCLLGMREGQESIFTVPPEKAFGQRNPNNIQVLSHRNFKEMHLEEGLVISFSDAGGQELPGVIKAIDQDDVTVDFNHPLSGRTLAFRVSILEVILPAGS